MRTLLKLVVTLLLAAVIPAHAGEAPVPALTNPRVIPDPAISGQPVSLRLRWNGCGGYSEPVVQVAGTVVTVNQTYFQICGIPPPGHDVDFAIGSFPAGSYTLTYLSQSEGAPVADPSINVPFVVTGAALTFSAPTLGGVAEGLLGLTLLLLAWCARSHPKNSLE